MGWNEHPPDPAMDALDDDHVIALIRENPEYFRVLYERYFERVYYYCLKRSNDVHISEDLSSEVFIKILSKLDSYRIGGNFAAWLFRIAHNTVVDHYRKHKQVIALDTVQVRGDSQMMDTIANQLTVEEMLSDLSDEERELLRLRIDAELSAPEIAEITGKTANAVRVQIYRILKRLRDSHDATPGDDS